MSATVIVIGGGVGGMSAAHELAERGFRVRVFERQDLPGGKARSVWVRGTGTGGRPDLPGEHGFRFFPRFYRHVIHTMRRIPVGGGRTAADNVVQANSDTGVRNLVVAGDWTRTDWNIGCIEAAAVSGLGAARAVR